MSDLDKFKEIVDYVLEIILGSKPKQLSIGIKLTIGKKELKIKNMM